MKLIKLLLLLLMIVGFTANAQIQTLWETNHPVGGDSLEVLFYKQDSAGNHYAGGSIGLTFFVSKFDSNGKHQWTVSDNKLIDKKVPAYETEDIVRSVASDIVFKGNHIYITGTKQHRNQWSSPDRGSGFNFILKLDTNGDSVLFINVLKEDIFKAIAWETGQRPLLKFINEQLYLFTSFWNLTSIPGRENINVFKYDENLNLLKYKMFEGRNQFSRDMVKNVQFVDNKIIINSLNGPQPRLLSSDTSFNLIWENVYGILGPPNGNLLPAKVQDSFIYSFASLRDTAQRKLIPVHINHIRKYDISNGQIHDSLTFYRTLSSDDIITDALILNENIYLCGFSIDSGIRKVFLLKFNNKIQLIKENYFETRILGDALMEYDGCLLYLSFIDSTQTGRELKLLRLDEQLNILSEAKYNSSTDKLSFLTSDKQIYLLSSGRNILSDTLSLRHLNDTISISAPTVFTSKATTSRSIELNWQLKDGLIDSIFIYKSLNGNSWQLWNNLSFNNLNIIDNNLTPSTKYYYSIRTKWQNEYSCTELFTSDSTPFNTNIFERPEIAFRIYPNPALSEIQIEGQDHIDTIELLNTTGFVIHYYQSQNSISVNDLIPGIYYLKINKTHNFKFIKL